MASVITSTFLGLNRLPLGEEGEGIEYNNLSLDFYPAMASGGFLDTDEVIYIRDGEEEEVDLSLLQAVGEIKEEDGKLYLTGVYDGNFYLAGRMCEYYGAGDRIEKDDKVVIKKLGKVWVILGVRGERSVIWSISEAEKTAKTAEGKEKEGKLISDMLRLKLPEYGFDGLWLYKLNDSENSGTAVCEVERHTETSYYCLYMSKRSPYNTNKTYYAPIQYTKLDIYEEYNSMLGSYMYLTSPHTDYDSEGYCFDDYESAHPIRFVIDAASRGDESVFERLDENERLRFADGLVWDTTYFSTFEDEYKPYGVDTTGLVYSAPVRKIYGEGESTSYDDYEITNHYYFPSDLEQGIIGHFEKWNEESGRYEPIYQDEAIYKRIDSETGKERTATTSELSTYFKSSGRSWEWSSSDTMTNTLVEVNATGLYSEAMMLSGMCEYMGRIYATVSDGTMFMASEMGSLTDFTEYEGIASDSGYFESLQSGKYTGICEYSGALIVFKEHSFSVYYGDTPSTLTLSREIKTVGCVDADSICEVNGVLFFLSEDGFCSFSGGVVENISRKLNYIPKSAKCFASGRKYYAIADGKTYVYDTDVGCWSTRSYIDFNCKASGRIICSDGIRRVAASDEWSGEWAFETMDIFEGITEDKGINEIYIRAKLTGTMVCKTVTDEEEREHMTVSGTGDRVQVFRIPVRLHHKNYYRIRLEGEGKCVIYAIERVVYAGGKQR